MAWRLGEEEEGRRRLGEGVGGTGVGGMQAAVNEYGIRSLRRG